MWVTVFRKHKKYSLNNYPMTKISFHTTELTQKLAEIGQYTFLVRGKLNKSEAKKVFEKEYGHKVQSIQAMNVRKKTSRGGRYTRRPNLKKFVVTFVGKAKIEINE